jgi:hypothetical protein
MSAIPSVPTRRTALATTVAASAFGLVLFTSVSYAHTIAAADAEAAGAAAGETRPQQTVDGY